MKKALWVLSIILFIFLESCKSDFNINDPNKEDVYVLNCILRKDRSIQYAIVSKNIYTENGTPPTQNDADQNIKGVKIKIFCTRSYVFVMRDTTIQLADSGNVTQVNCYYAKNVIIIPGTYITIKATLPDGVTLKSTTHVPRISYTNFSLNFPQIYSRGYRTYPNYSWEWIGESAPILDLPQLEVYYQKYEDGAFVNKTVSVPLAFYFTYNENGLVPVSDSLSVNTYCITTLRTIDKTMQEISGDDPVKSNYKINKVVFSVEGLGPNLSKYYYAYNTYKKDFTIKLRQTDFSNIEGGKGIFGVYYKSSQSLALDSLFVRSFGYQYDPK